MQSLPRKAILQSPDRYDIMASQLLLLADATTTISSHEGKEGEEELISKLHDQLEIFNKIQKASRWRL